MESNARRTISPQGDEPDSAGMLRRASERLAKPALPVRGGTPCTIRRCSVRNRCKGTSGGWGRNDRKVKGMNPRDLLAQPGRRLEAVPQGRAGRSQSAHSSVEAPVMGVERRGVARWSSEDLRPGTRPDDNALWARSVRTACSTGASSTTLAESDRAVGGPSNWGESQPLCGCGCEGRRACLTARLASSRRSAPR